MRSEYEVKRVRIEKSKGIGTKVRRCMLICGMEKKKKRRRGKKEKTHVRGGKKYRLDQRANDICSVALMPLSLSILSPSILSLSLSFHFSLL